jgi:hypothetical protein
MTLHDLQRLLKSLKGMQESNKYSIDRRERERVEFWLLSVQYESHFTLKVKQKFIDFFLRIQNSGV